MDATDTPRRYLTTAQASRQLSISPRTLERWRVDGGGPPFRKLGQLVRYAVEDLDAWTSDARRVSTSDRGPNHQPAA